MERYVYYSIQNTTLLGHAISFLCLPLASGLFIFGVFHLLCIVIVRCRNLPTLRSLCPFVGSRHLSVSRFDDLVCLPACWIFDRTLFLFRAYLVLELGITRDIEG